MKKKVDCKWIKYNAMKLEKGIYENLIDSKLAADIKVSEENGLICSKDAMDAAESSRMLAEYLAEAVRRKLDDSEKSLADKKDLVNAILDTEIFAGDKSAIVETNLLTEVMDRREAAERKAVKREALRPRTGFRVSNLFTGGQSAVQLGHEIVRDIASADRICIIVSFLRLSGIRMLLEDLRRFCEVDGHRLQIITTTYCGITEAKAVEQLASLPNTEIRISYNTEIERLHAKAYIFVRNSGLSTAYIGSSNLSKSAQTDGLEWNLRVTNVENPHIIKSALATFDMYWNSENFEDFGIGGIEKFNRELKRQRDAKDPQKQFEMFNRYQVLPHQKQILDRLQVEREENDIWRNLVVAATGTGKTVVAAFDYKRFHEHNRNRSRLLFVAHRKEILKQSERTFRSVMCDQNFGERWDGESKPVAGLDHLFISITMLNNRMDDTFKELGADYYDYIVIDEVHHAAADSYKNIISFFKPKILLGLTATPERMDGQSLLPDFGGRISAEIRLPQALDEGLLTPFQYFCISDTVDLREDGLMRGDKLIVDKLSDKLCDGERVNLIVKTLGRYLPDEHNCRALCFCSDKRHAQFMAERFAENGLRSGCLTSDVSAEERVRLNYAIQKGEINYLFVVDIFNEGVDIPEIDTVLFLRPTDSLTVFLQQLGRGLRLCESKDCLTVFDFVAQMNRRYDFSEKFRALSLQKKADVKKQIQENFPDLPHGCAIFMERKAREYVLQNIQKATFRKNILIDMLRKCDGTPTISEFLKDNSFDVRVLYNKNCWTKIKKEAGKCTYDEDRLTKLFEKGIGRLTHINSASQIRFIRRFLNDGCSWQMSDRERCFATMLYYALFQEPVKNLGFGNMQEALETIRNYPLFVQEIRELTDYIMENLEFRTSVLSEAYPSALELHGCYSREEIFIIFGLQDENKQRKGHVAGLQYVEDCDTELFFVTLNKSDKDFSPTTQYDDYFISADRFHWQSQNRDSHGNRGDRYVHNNGRRFMLFVRENKRDGFGNTSPYYCMGMLNYLDSYGDFPMNIRWQLEQPALPQFIKAV